VTPNATTTTASSASDSFDVALSQGQVEASFARYGKAHIETDVPALEELLAADYQHFHASGRIDGKQSLIARLLCGEIKHIAKENAFVQVKIYGGVAILSGRGRNTVMVDNQTKVIENLFTSVWIRTAPEKWAITSWTAAPVTSLTRF
jgi:hypothetical protein